MDVSERWKTWGKIGVVLFVIDIIVYFLSGLIFSAYDVAYTSRILDNSTITIFFIASQIMVLVIMLGIEYLRWYFKYQDNTKLYWHTYGARASLFIVAIAVILEVIKMLKGNALFTVLNGILILDIVGYYIMDFVERINSSLKRNETQKIYTFWISFLALFCSFISILVSVLLSIFK